ncbi:MAG: 5-formyltetrahydrofolate cyclo-ligase [Novosphingobium sp.]
MNEKQLLRARMRAERRAHVDALPDSTRALIMMRPPAPVAAMVPEGGVVGLYHPLPHEAPTAGYARWFYENGRTLALPWFADRMAPMQFLEWGNPFDDNELEAGPFGPQPRAHSALAKPDTAFVPLLAFTADGQRLGQGGGHYDRWLAGNPDVLPIGLAWDMQLVDSLPVEPHDRTLAAVVTPTRFYRITD